MGRNTQSENDTPYSPCPHCRSVNGRIIPVAGGVPGLIYLQCEECHEVWTVRQAPLNRRAS